MMAEGNAETSHVDLVVPLIYQHMIQTLEVDFTKPNSTKKKKIVFCESEIKAELTRDLQDTINKGRFSANRKAARHGRTTIPKKRIRKGI